MSDQNLSKNIAFRADLQDQTGGIKWGPAIRGFWEGDFFLIMKTFEDTSENVRRGRKFSHVLIIERKDIIEVSDLRPIMDLLPEKIEKEIELTPLEIERQTDASYNNLDQHLQGRFNKLIHGYVNLSKFKNKIVWIGQDDFDIAVIEFWKRLTKKEREVFHFDISFNNDNKEGNGLRFIAVPENVRSKFLKSDFFIVEKNDFHDPSNLLELLLIGDQKIDERIKLFETAIESESLSREDINYVAIGIETFENLDVVEDIKKLNTLAHIIAKFSPLDNLGHLYKKKLVARAVKLIENGDFTEFQVLRNFKIESFKNSKKELSQALNKWINKNIFSKIQAKNYFIPFFKNVKANNLNWWDETINSTLHEYLGVINITKVSAIYQWLIDVPDLLSKLEEHIDNSKESEICFSKKLPKKLPNFLLGELKMFAISNNWFSYFAKLLNFEKQLEDALDELFKIDKDEQHFDAINIILAGKKEQRVIDYAVYRDHNRMIKIAGEICHKSPTNLERIDVSNYNWQKIWLETIRLDGSIENGLKQPQDVIFSLFDHIISGSEFCYDLLVEISLTEFANIQSYSNMAKLWEHLPPDIVNNFLVKTSAHLLSQLSINSTTQIPDDPVLIDHIGQKGISDFLYYNNNNIKSVIPIFEKFSQLNDNNLRTYLNNFTGTISAVEATRLGKLVWKRSFTNCAYLIYDKSNKHNNWRFALEECHRLLDIITKGILSVSGILSKKVKIPTDEWWQSTEELITDLYPNSVSMTTIWRQSGGKESDLLMNVSAAHAWNDALFKLRKKQFKDLTMNDLLKGIKKQYANNEKFKIIYNLRKYYIKT